MADEQAKPRRRRGPVFEPASVATGLQAGASPVSAPSDTPDNLLPRRVPVDEVTLSDDFASKQASNIARQGSNVVELDITDLLEGRPDPEMDLIPLNVRVPRYVIQALSLESKRTRRPQQAITADALKNAIRPDVLAMAHRKVSGR